MINVATVVGRLGHDPELRYSSSGTAYLHVRVACTEYFRDANGVKQQRVHWIRGTAFTKVAEIIAQYFSKGSQIGISGPLNFKSWQDNQGNTHSSLDIMIRDFTFIDSLKDHPRDKNPEAGKGSEQEAGILETVPPSESPDEIPF